jgi:hypothetical protein
MNDNTTKPASATMGHRDPDELLVEVRRSIMGFAVVVSTIIHLVVIGFTSFGLYRDWGEYRHVQRRDGFPLPRRK